MKLTVQKYKRTSTDSKKQRCPYCGKNWNYSLDRHITLSHQGVLTIRCSQCLQKFEVLRIKGKGDVVKPTRFYSNKQEKTVAKAVNGKQVANSGATPISKGDVRTDNWLIECKTSTTRKQSFSIKKEWLEKNKEEAFAMNKLYSALAFDFGIGHNYYIVDEKTFIKMKDALEE